MSHIRYGTCMKPLTRHYAADARLGRCAFDCTFTTERRYGSVDLVQLDSQFGEAFALVGDDCLVGLGFASLHDNGSRVSDWINKKFGSRIREQPITTVPWLVAGLRGEGRIKMLARGTEFQLAVWQALLEIEPGTCVSYSDIGARLGRHNAERAIGGAIGSNPISWFIPCHRVIRKDGSLGGYAWGLSVKEDMLDVERAARSR